MPPTEQVNNLERYVRSYHQNSAIFSLLVKVHLHISIICKYLKVVYNFIKKFHRKLLKLVKIKKFFLENNGS